MGSSFILVPQIIKDCIELRTAFLRCKEEARGEVQDSEKRKKDSDGH